MRCPHLRDRVELARPLHPEVFEQLTDLLGEFVKAGDVPATATLLGALRPHFLEMPPATTGRREHSLRTAAEAFDARFGPDLDAMRRCRLPRLCPACFAGEPCALDVWRLALGSLVLGGNEEKYAPNFFFVNGLERDLKVWGAMRKAGRHRLADATLRLVHLYWLATKNADRAAGIASTAMESGCRDPEIAEARAQGLARRGRKADLEEAVRLCDNMLETQDGSTDDAWQNLEVLRARIAGRLARANNPESRHYPVAPKRTRPPRFSRPASISVE